MAFIIRNKTLADIDIDDIGTRLKASADRDITILGLGEIFDSADLQAFVVAGDIVIMDSDGTTELSADDSLSAANGSSTISGSTDGQIISEVVDFVPQAAVAIVSQNTFVDVPGATLNITTTETGSIWATVSFNGLCSAGNTAFDARITFDGVGADSVQLRLEAANMRDNHVDCRSASLAPGTYTVKLQMANIDSTADCTVENFAMFAMSLTAPAGAPGAAGPTGAGSSVIIQEEGVNIANTPHSTLNIIGDNVTATDAGGGVTDITITGGGSTTEFDRQGVITATNFSTSSQSDVDLTSSTLTTKDLGANGDYIISFSCEYQIGKNDKSAIFSVSVGGVNAVEMMAVGVEDKGNNWLNFSLTHLEPAVANATEIKIQVRSEDGTTLEVEKRELVIDGVLSTNVLP